MRALTKKQRNALYDEIVTAGLDPARCDFADDEQDVRLTHNPTGSIFSAQPHKYEGYTVRRSVGDEPGGQFFEPSWTAVVGSAGIWAESVEEFAKAPDLWAELRRERKFLCGDEYESASNAPFSPQEQSRIAGQLRDIKDYLADRYPLSDEEVSDVEVRLDDVAAAAGRAGRRDWLLMFYGVMFTLIVTALLPPDTVQRVMAMVSHGLGDLFGFDRTSPAA